MNYKTIKVEIGLSDDLTNEAAELVGLKVAAFITDQLGMLCTVTLEVQADHAPAPPPPPPPPPVAP